jgi:hypothetical protein
MNIERGIRNFVYDVIGGGDSPSENKGEKGLPSQYQNRCGWDRFPVQKEEVSDSRKDGQTPGPPFQPHGLKIWIHF